MRTLALLWICLFGATAGAQCVGNPPTNSQLDPDYLFAGLDESLAGTYPQWVARWAQDNTTDPTPLFVGEDNSQNGIRDDDHLALLSAILHGEPTGTVLGGLAANNISEIRAAYASNRAKVRPDLTLTIIFVTVNIIDEINKGDPTFGESLQDLVAAYMTIGDAESVAFIRGLLITLGEIFIEVGVANGDIPALVEDLTKSTLRSTVNANYVASRYASFGDAPGATKPNLLGDTGNIGGSAQTNEAEYAAQAGNREAWLIAKGVTVPPLHIVTPPADATVESGAPVSIAPVIAGGTPATTLHDWKRVIEGNGATSTAATTAVLEFAYPLPSDSGLFRYFVCDGTWVRQAMPNRLTVEAGTFRVTLQPSGTSRSVGQSVTFSVAVRGGEVLPQYAWYTGPSVGALSLIPGETGPELTIDNLTLDDAGVYQARITGGPSTAPTTLNSNAVTLAVLAAGDTTSPTLTLNGAAELALECGTPYSEPGATAIDLVDGVLTGQIEITGSVDASQPGEYTLTYRVEDAAGNSATATRTVTVDDNTEPQLTLLGGSTVSVECGQFFSDLGATAIDNCDGALAVISSGAVDTAAQGTYTLTYSATDDAGNVASVQRTVQVVDTAAPKISLMGASTIVVECGGTFTDPGASASDDCAGDVSASLTSSGTVDTSTPGNYLRTYSVADPAGNRVSLNRSVRVRDVDAPEITVLGANPLEIDCGATFIDPGATALDVCEGSLGAVLGAGSVNTQSPGTYAVRYTKADAEGNLAEATRTVVVSDTALPLISLTGAAELTLACGTAYSEPGATAQDTCDGVVSVAISGSVGSAPGVYTITYAADDSAGNSAETTRTVTVSDGVSPVVTLGGDALVEIDCGGVYTEIGATAFDACEDAAVAVSIAGEVDTGVIGDTTLTYSATDTAENVGQATRIVRVRRVVPVLETGIANNEFRVDCGAPLQLPDYVALEPCIGDVSETVTVRGLGAVDTGTPGEYEVFYDLPDAEDNVSTTTVRVVVEDTTAPVLTLRGAAEVTLNCGTAYVEPGVTAQDACDGNLSSGILVQGSVNTAQPGDYTLNYRVADSTGNLGTATRLVQVTGAQAAVITLLGASVTTVSCGGQYAEPGFTATDICGGVATARVQVSGAVNTSAPGVYALTYTFTPEQGGPAQATRTVEVLADCSILLLGEPEDQPLYAGLTAQFRVRAEGGSAALTYTWYFDAQTDAPPVIVGTGTPLVLEDVDAADIGGYYCVVSDGFSEVSTRVALLTLFERPATGHATADQNEDWSIDIEELLRVIQFYNSLRLHCEEGTEDGYAVGPGDETCAPHTSDYAPQDWVISLDELLRAIQFYNSPGGAYHREEGTEDGFAPGAA